MYLNNAKTINLNNRSNGIFLQYRPDGGNFQDFAKIVFRYENPERPYKPTTVVIKPIYSNSKRLDVDVLLQKVVNNQYREQFCECLGAIEPSIAGAIINIDYKD